MNIDMSLKNNFPSLHLYPKPLIPFGRLNFFLAPIIGAVIGAFAGVSAGAISGIIIGGVLISTQVLSAIIVAAVVIGISLATMSSSGGSRRAGAGPTGAIGGSNIEQNGQLVNTRQASKVLPVLYGICKVGGNWIFSRPSQLNNNILNTVITWSEGEIEGIATAIDYTPLFTGAGLNDIHTGGIFVPTSMCTCDGSCYSHSDCSCDMACDSVYA